MMRNIAIILVFISQVQVFSSDDQIAYPIAGECDLASSQICATSIGIFNVISGESTYFYVGDYEPSSLEWSLENGIFFEKHGATDIQLLNPQTGEVQTISGTSEIDVMPSWSENGQQLAFLSMPLTSDYSSNLYITQIENEEPEQLTANLSLLGKLVWSSDNQLAFTVRQIWTDVNSDEIYILDVNSRRITRMTNNNISDFAPDWSPDGNWLAFLSGVSPNYNVVVSDVATNEQLIVTQGLSPRWVSNHEILYIQQSPDSESYLYVRDLISTEVRLLRSANSITSINVSPQYDKVLYMVRQTESDDFKLCILEVKTSQEGCFPDLPVYGSSIAVWGT